MREVPKATNGGAKALGVHHTTVTTQRKELEATGDVAKLATSTGADGKVYPRKPVSVFNPTKREERAMKKPEVVERMHSTRLSARRYKYERAAMREKCSK